MVDLTKMSDAEKDFIARHGKSDVAHKIVSNAIDNSDYRWMGGDGTSNRHLTPEHNVDLMTKPYNSAYTRDTVVPTEHLLRHALQIPDEDKRWDVLNNLSRNYHLDHVKRTGPISDEMKRRLMNYEDSTIGNNFGKRIGNNFGKRIARRNDNSHDLMKHFIDHAPEYNLDSEDLIELGRKFVNPDDPVEHKIAVRNDILSGPDTTFRQHAAYGVLTHLDSEKDDERKHIIDEINKDDKGFTASQIVKGFFQPFEKHPEVVDAIMRHPNPAVQTMVAITNHFHKNLTPEHKEMLKSHPNAIIASLAKSTLR